MMNTENKDYKIEYHRRIEKAFKKMSNNEFRLIDKKIQELRHCPRGRGRQKIGEDIYRVRRGRFRIIYHVDDERRLIRIGKVARRREDTYKNIEDLFH